MKKTHYIAIVVACCLLFAGCSLDTPPVTHIQLQEDVELNLWQQLTENGAVPQIQLVSTETYNCSDAKIISNFSLNNQQRLTLALEAIEIPENCTHTDPVYLTNAYSLELMDGVYDLHITIGDLVSNEGSLQINREQIEIQLNSSDGIKHRNAVMHRIPDNTAWGYLIDANNQEELTHNLLSDVELVLNTNLSSGSYSYFTVEENGTVTILDRDSQVKGFIVQYKDQSDWDQIIENAANLDFNSSTSLFIQNYNGQHHRI